MYNVADLINPLPYNALNVWDFIRIVYKLLRDPLKRVLGSIRQKLLAGGLEQIFHTKEYQ
jgi:hypothetical protein